MNYEISTDSAPGGEVSLVGNVSGILDFFFVFFVPPPTKLLLALIRAALR